MNNPNQEDIILDANVLYESYKMALKASPMKPLTQKFEDNWLHNIGIIQGDLRSGRYVPAKKTEFIIRERGKVRLIRGAPMRDKVVQHALCDFVLIPAIRPKIIYDNYASLKLRGISMARKRFEMMVHKFYRKHKTNQGFILLMDFSGYYDNMRHNLVRKIVGGIIKGPVSTRTFDSIVDSCKQDVSFLSDDEIKRLYEGKYKALDYVNVPKELRTGKKWLYKGMDIGDQTAQGVAIYFPTKIDYHMKIVRGEKYYGRYMDDSNDIHISKQHLIEVLSEVKEIAASLGIILNDKKVKILPLSKPFTYLQIKYFLTPTGRLVKRINPKRVTAMRRKLKKLHKMLLAGQRKFKSIYDLYHGWERDYFRLMSKIQRRNMKTLFYSLFSEEVKKYEEALQIRPKYREIYWRSRS